MSKGRPTYEQLEKKIRELQKEVKDKKEAYDTFIKWIDQKTREFESYKSTADLLELYLDEDWHIIFNSNSFTLLTENIVGLRVRREHVRNFLKEGHFDKIQEYLDKLDAIKKLPYAKSGAWELIYKGPLDSEKVGKDWMPFSFSGINQWKIENGKIIHRPAIKNEEDCYLMTAKEYGNAEKDLKVKFKVRTSNNKELTRDLSLVLSGASSEVGIHPDLVGYTACSGSKENTEGRIQRTGISLVVVREELAPDTEYQITVERTGGRLTRELINLNNGEKGQYLEAIDPDAIYDKQNHIGFTTFSGEAVIYDLEIYTRKSLFSIDQFKIPFDAEVGIRDEKLEGKVFKLRTGKYATAGESLNLLLFEDITERKRVEDELKISREQLRELAAHLQLIREEERSQIAREIHDELGQALTALHLDLLSLKKKLPKNQDAVFKRIDSMLNLIDSSNKSVHRISTNLRPGLLDDLGLTAAIEWQLEEFQIRTGIKCEINLDSEVNVSDENLSITVFRIFQEALTNVVRHAKATRVSVELKKENGKLVLKVKDNGIGIKDSQISDSRSFGLIGIRERLFPWEGELEITGIPNRETSLTVIIPLKRR
ncbi:MAG TPA: histidine kinase [archaeon]|nr:histidine kinase [archaeon]